MLRNWLRRAVRSVLPALHDPVVVMGTRPGYVWEPERNRWVDEEETWKPGRAEYTLIGPVHVSVGMQP